MQKFMKSDYYQIKKKSICVSLDFYSEIWETFFFLENFWKKVEN